MADESMQNSHGVKESEAKTHIPIVLKIVEVALAIFAIGLIVDPFNSFQMIFNKPRTKLNDIAVVYISIGGYMIVNTIFIIGHILGDRMPKRTSVMFSAIGCLFHIVAGSVIVHNWRKLHGDYVYVQNNAIYPSKMYMDMLISGAIFTFVDSVVFGLDIFLTCKYA